jgi:hypothetical protein
MANQEKDRTLQLNRGLDKVLLLFTVRHSVFSAPVPQIDVLHS